jgi:hypothetical protein
MGWIDFSAGMAMGAYMRLADNFQMDCQAASFAAVDKVILAAQFWNMPTQRSTWPGNVLFYVKPYNAVMALKEAWNTCNSY